MLVYLFLLFIILVLNRRYQKALLSPKMFYTLIGTAFILITGLRHPDVGSDTSVYYHMFQETRLLSFEELIGQGKRDYGFFIISWLVGQVTDSFTVMTLLAAVFFYVPLMMFLKKNSPDTGLSCIVLMAFTFFQFSMTGMRQTMAFGLSLLFIMEVMKENPSWRRMLIFFLIGYILHKSAALMLVYLIIQKIGDNRFFNGLLILLVPISFIFRQQIAFLALPFFEENGFDFAESAEGAGLTTYLVFLGLFIWMQFSKKKTFSSMEYHLMSIIVITQSFVMVQSVFFRGVWYFSLFLTIIVPKLVESASPKNRNTIRLCMYGAMLFMYIFITMGAATVLPYKFFFQ